MKLYNLFGKIQISFRSNKIRKFVFLKKPEYFERYANSGKDFLIIAPGPSIIRQKETIYRFIEKNNPIVLGCNNVPGCFEVDYHLFLNRRRFCQYADKVNKETKLLLSPYFSKRIIKKAIGPRTYEPIMFKDVHYQKTEDTRFEMEHGIISSKGATVTTIACGVAIAMGGKNIYLAGCDGWSIYGEDVKYYKEEDKKTYLEILKAEKTTNEILSIIEKMLCQRAGKISIITNTSYSGFYDPLKDER